MSTISAFPRPTLLGGASPSASVHGAPNVLQILIDDLGPEQLLSYLDTNLWSSYDYAPTPNIDALARRGLRFRRAYGAPICSPCRGQITTGLWPHRTGLSIVINEGAAHVLEDVTDEDVGLGIRCWPRILRDPSIGSPYRIRHQGKWHLGDGNGDNNSPTRDAFLARYQGCLTNLNVSDSGVTNTGYGADGSTQYSVFDSKASSTTVVTADYNPDNEIEGLLTWMREGRQPWCLQWWVHSIHGPYHWAPSAHHTYGAEPGSFSAWTAARTMIESIDTLIGELFARMGPMLENTVVILACDNGTDGLIVDPDHASNAVDPPPSGPYDPDHFKQEVYEGGCRIPFIMAGPGVRSGVTDALVSVMDIAPTTLELCAPGQWQGLVSGTDLAGNAVTEMDGKSLLGICAGTEESVHTHMLAEKYGTEGMRLDDPTVDRARIGVWDGETGFKLVAIKNSSAGDWTTELYDLGVDPTNYNDPHEATPLDPEDYPVEYAALTAFLEAESGLSL